ncbi:MAG: glycosyltransferase [Sphingopyxis sp.]|nr:glycosyltransferase [Sphingopyxis sp.]
MPALRLSVIMPMHNAAPFVGMAIDSILAQSAVDFTFYIVDDGSTDGSGAIAAEKAARDPRIRLIVQENRGIVASLNHMLALVDTDFVARMDADDVALPLRFEKQLARLEAEPALGALGTQFIEIAANGRILDAHYRQPTGTETIRAELAHRQPIANPSAMFRTQALRDAGLYRQAFRHCEDYDLFLRLSEIADIDNLPDILLHYRRSPGQMSVLNNAPQTRQAAYARLAHYERLAGRPDPFVGLDALPPTAELDALLGQPGVGARLEAAILTELRYAVATMNDAEFADYCARVADGIAVTGGGRAVLRCLAGARFGRAARLTLALLRRAMGQRRVANRSARD